MTELNELLRPTWGSEKWIFEGWDIISNDEREQIKHRIDELFQDGLPFELKHSKLLYIYTFSMLAQLEVLAIQVPLRFKDKITSPHLRERLHIQLLDEIFHGMVFTKIVYMLSAPHSTPPAYNDNIEILCNFIRNEDCPKVGMMLLNLIGEGWIEEIFNSLHDANIAPTIFKTIIADEHRHVHEADLYREIGLPDMNIVRPKVAFLEEQLLANIFMQYKYSLSISTLLGVKGAIQFIEALNAKHTNQLKKINLLPSDKWNLYMQMAQAFIPGFLDYSQQNREIEMTPIRQVMMTQWDNPSDPTMAGEFNIDVSCLDFFEKKFPPETITTLMLQTISHTLAENDFLRNYLSHHKLYQSKSAFVGIVVKLPDCGDHIGTILFKDCHLMTVPALAGKIRDILQMMVYCFKKRSELEYAHPHLKLINQELLYEFANDVYGFPIPGNSFISLSNIGSSGYTRAKSPLRSNESMKFTLMQVERKMVWNKSSKRFEEQDILPVSISADHRIFDGNVPMPKMIAAMFERSFNTMIKQNAVKPAQSSINKMQDAFILRAVDQALMNNPEFGYKLLTVLQTVWPEFLKLEDMLYQ